MIRVVVATFVEKYLADRGVITSTDEVHLRLRVNYKLLNYAGANLNSYSKYLQLSVNR
ncbi:hypothetical protein GCM10027299_08840 [Larkinella ripae]